MATPAGRRARAVQPGLRRQVRPRERQARPRPDARHLRRARATSRSRPATSSRRSPASRSGRSTAAPRRSRRTEVFAQGAARRGVACSRCSTTTSAGSPTAASPPTTSSSCDGNDYPYVRRVGDGDRAERRPLRRAQARGRGKGRRSVVLGGHSLGASLTAAYASWDFNGTPGYKDIDGMVLIDGGLMGSFDAFTAAEAQAALDKLASGEPVPRPARHRASPRSPASSARSAAIYARRAPERVGDDAPVVLAAAAGVQPAIPGHQPGRCSATRSTATPRPHGLRCCTSTPARSRRAAIRATGSTAASPRSSGWRRRSARSPPTRSSGTSRAGSRSTRTGPTSWSRTTSRTCSACASSTSGRSTIPLYAIQTDLTKGTGAARREQLHRARRGRRARSRRWSTPIPSRPTWIR